MNIHAIFPKLQTAVFGRAGVWLIVLALSAILCGALLLGSLPHQPAQAAAPRTAAGQSQPIEPGQTPDGLSAAEWNGIQAQIAAGKYRAYASAAGGFVSANPAHGWQIAYGADGVTRLTPRQAGDWQVGLQLTGYGYEADRSENLAGLVPTLAADGQTLTYRWDDNLSEWWVNRANGLEQGFTLRARPGAANGQPLALELAVTGSLTPAQNGGGVAFLDDRGASVLTYDKLLVTDANGKTIPARFSLSQGERAGVRGNALRIVVDDTHAAYPLTIDPLFQQAYLKASNTEMNDSFGASVAVSGDTLVVGAPYEASNATGVNGNQADNSAAYAGAAYVFTRSGGVWSQQAYLKASNTEANDYFGYAVAVDGDTVVVGAPYEDSNATGVNGNQADNSAYSAGAAYVFAEGFCSQQSGAFSSAATWRGGAAPGSSDLACVSSGHTVTLGAAAAVGSLRVYPGGALDLATYGFSAESGVTNDGVISQTQTVNNASVEFVRIQNAAATATQYRGLLVDATANAQNLGAVSVGVRELNTGEYCTTTGAGSPVYARRCYTIVPATQPAAAVRLRLYARTADELNGIAQANLSVYRFAGGWNELLTNRAAGSDGGAYSYAEGDTTGFSAFLLGQTGNVPTAITLQAFTANSSGKLGLAALVWVAALVSLAGLRLRRRRQV